jgi:exportin-1
MYSELISAAISTGGPHASRTSQVKLMRSCKKVALKAIEVFVEKCEDPTLLAEQIVPAMMDPILGDYSRNVPDARCPPPPRRPHLRVVKI